MPDIWPPTPALKDGRFHIIVEIWEPLSPSLRQYKLEVLISKMRLSDGWTVHIPETMDGPYGVFHSGNDKAEFEREVLFLKYIKEGRKEAGSSTYGDRFAYTKLETYTFPVDELSTVGTGSNANSLMDIDEDEQFADMNVESKFDNGSNVGANPGYCSPSQTQHPVASQVIANDSQMDDADKALDEAIFEMDNHEKAAKEGFDALVEQFELLTGNDTDSADSSIHFGAV